MNIQKMFESKTSKNLIIGIVSVAVVFAIFQAGVFVGFHKASFLFGFGDNYYRAFGKDDGRGMMLFKDDMTGGHGAVGRIVKVNLPTFVVVGPDNVEKIITINDKTQIRAFRDATSTSALTMDQFVTVLGNPNENGQVEASFIRIMPPPPPPADPDSALSAPFAPSALSGPEDMMSTTSFRNNKR